MSDADPHRDSGRLPDDSPAVGRSGAVGANSPGLGDRDIGGQSDASDEDSAPEASVDSSSDRGRDATKPTDIPPKGWKDIALRVKDELGTDRVGFASAGVAFYLLMGFFPTLAAVVFFYGLLSDPADVERQISSLSSVIPPEAMEIFGSELKRIAADDRAAGWGALLSVLLALWGGSQAMDSLVTALNVAYDEDEKRGWLRRKILALALTLGFAVALVLVALLLAAVPLALALFSLDRGSGWMVELLKWPLLLLVVSGGISLLYRYAPDREDAKWRWVTPGSVLATLLWIAGSALFSWYASSFGNYAATYGSVGGIVVLLLWFYITGFVIMLGAEVNAEIEHQTARDSTTGPPQPIGQRGAFVADDVGEAKGKQDRV